jgi:hypothetical protein
MQRYINILARTTTAIAATTNGDDLLAMFLIPLFKESVTGIRSHGTGYGGYNWYWHPFEGSFGPDGKT